MSGLAALILTAVALPSLLARLTGGHPPKPGPQLAAFAPVAALPAVAAVVIAATTAWWLAALLAIPAAILVAWQLPPPRPARYEAAAGPARGREPGPYMLTLRALTLNVLHGSADAAAVVRNVRQHNVDVLFVQELTPEIVGRLAETDLDGLLPFSHLHPRPAAGGTGLWARWPLTPLPPVPGTLAATPRARVDPVGGRPVTLTAVHPKAPLNRYEHQWQRELTVLREVLTGTEGPQVVAGDFNATRDHQPFRDLLAAGFLDCGDAARRRPWPGFTWPSVWPGFIWRVHPPFLPIMRLDHVLVSRAAATVLGTRVIRVPGTDHCGVLAVIELKL
ncbi:MAG TPA: endonuclease/exonuclease/phosphatase family protein [Streptosporangiaceae bacterium]|nr:endonuclease/exonuclease/phosphatase family protein [Streptosporangiaceae bacterium]